MYLTKIEMELSSPAVRAALQDAQKMHRLVCGCFGQARKEADILYRCRTRGIYADLYLYSARAVDRERLLPGMRLCAERDVTPWLDAMSAGDVFRFQVVTVPFRKTAEPGVKNSRRRALAAVEERIAWLERKAAQNGFEILSVQETPAEKLTARRAAEAGGSLTVDAYTYTGILRISDASLFRQAMCRGIGAEKAYGLGMLMLGGC